jgi:flagellar assembly protein FliH
MMILPSDQSQGESSVANVPTRLLDSDFEHDAQDDSVNKPRGRRAISRLEFYSAQSITAETAIPEERVTSNAMVQMKGEMAALNARLREQDQEISALVASARKEGKAEARVEWEHELEQMMGKEISRVSAINEEFQRERRVYFAGVEGEVVKLALAIAARVLHREATMDPLLLTGAVRVAMEKIADDSAVKMRVSVGELELWQGVLAATRHPGLQIVGDERLQDGSCVLETSVGRVELGVSAQLKEIERGFFDLLQQRPA